MHPTGEQVPWNRNRFQGSFSRTDLSPREIRRSTFLPYTYREYRWGDNSMVLGRLRRTRQSKVVEESKARSGKKRLDGTVSMSSGSSNCRSKPKNTRSSSMRVSSLEDSLHRSGLSQSKRGSNNQKRISFGTICVRDYERVASDNPSVSRGVPIGWVAFVFACGTNNGQSRYYRSYDLPQRWTQLLC